MLLKEMFLVYYYPSQTIKLLYGGFYLINYYTIVITGCGWSYHGPRAIACADWKSTQKSFLCEYYKMELSSDLSDNCLFLLILNSVPGLVTIQ